MRAARWGRGVAFARRMQMDHVPAELHEAPSSADDLEGVIDMVMALE